VSTQRPDNPPATDTNDDDGRTASSGSPDSPIDDSNISKQKELASKKSVAATMLLFGFNGLAMGVFAGALATVKELFDLSAMQVSGLLVMSGVMAVIAMQTCGRMSDHHGARRFALAGIIPLAIGTTTLALAPNYAVTLVGTAFLGLGNGALDVSMNAIAVQVEAARGKGIMSFFHGLWSGGNLLGSGALAAAAALTALSGGGVLKTVLFGVTGLGVVVLFVAFQIVPDTQRVVQVDETGTKVKLPPTIYLLGLMALMFGLGEGSAFDWSGIHVSEVAGVDPGQGALAVTALATAITIVRLTGDLIVAKFGPRLVVRTGAVLAVAGYLIAAFGNGFGLLVAGWAMVGFGMGIVAPQVYSLAGHTGGGRGLATVVTFGYAVFLVGPAILGALVTWLGIQHAMLVPGLAMIGLLFLAQILPAKGAEAKL
jgi:MFS family permease